MRTEELIDLLAMRATPVRAASVRWRFAGVIAAGVLAAALATLVLLGPRADLLAAAGTAMFWWKLAFPMAVALFAFVSLRRLGYPGWRLGMAPLLALAPFALVWVAAALVLASAEPAGRADLLMGDSGLACAAMVVLLSIPAGLAALWALRTLAPTRPRLSGAFAGLFAGAVAASAYALHCTEMQLPFIGAWYAAGMLLPAVLGASMGARWLRW